MLDDQQQLLTQFLALRQSIIDDCAEARLPRFVVVSVLQSVCFQLQAEVAGLDPSAKWPNTG